MAVSRTRLVCADFSWPGSLSLVTKAFLLVLGLLPRESRSCFGREAAGQSGRCVSAVSQVPLTLKNDFARVVDCGVTDLVSLSLSFRVFVSLYLLYFISIINQKAKWNEMYFLGIFCYICWWQNTSVQAWKKLDLWVHAFSYFKYFMYFQLLLLSCTHRTNKST